MHHQRRGLFATSTLAFCGGDIIISSCTHESISRNHSGWSSTHSSRGCPARKALGKVEQCQSTTTTVVPTLGSSSGGGSIRSLLLRLFRLLPAAAATISTSRQRKYPLRRDANLFLLQPLDFGHVRRAFERRIVLHPPSGAFVMQFHRTPCQMFDVRDIRVILREGRWKGRLRDEGGMKLNGGGGGGGGGLLRGLRMGRVERQVGFLSRSSLCRDRIATPLFLRSVAAAASIGSVAPIVPLFDLAITPIDPPSHADQSLMRQ
mmetsp:Transcript_4843/g.9038  ORF Transcript_4843/g.9038 Transcript_4843/m.9038 type:complete len:262 (+) Transcript_4843:494-1279(+)